MLGIQPKSGSRDRSEWVTDCLQAKNDIINKTRNSKCFSDATLLFLKTCIKAVDTSVRCSLSNNKKEFLRKCAVPIQYLRSDEMLTGLMSVSLFYRYFHNFHKGLSPQKK